MSLIARGNETTIEPVEEGTHLAICSMLIDLGIQKPNNEKYKEKPKIMISFAVTDETYENTDGEEVYKTISKEYTNSLSSRANLLKDLNAWRGKKFTEEELKGFDLRSIVKVPCQISVTHTEKDGTKYANIASVTGVPKGVKVDAKVDSLIFDLDDESTYDKFVEIPEWIRKKITSCVGFEKTKFSEYHSKLNFEDINNDDLPF